MINRDRNIDYKLQVHIWENETSIWKYGDEYIIMLKNTDSTGFSIEIKIAINLLLRTLV